MEAAERTRRLEQALTGGAWSFVLMVMSVGTAVLVIDPRWMAVALPCAAGGLLAAVVGFARMADWFGGSDHWQRARHEAALVAAALCTLAGLMVARPANSARRVSFGDGDAVPVQVAAVIAIAAALFGLYRIGTAFNDLRSRVVAANESQARRSTLTTHG